MLSNLEYSCSKTDKSQDFEKNDYYCAICNIKYGLKSEYKYHILTAKHLENEGVLKQIINPEKSSKTDNKIVNIKIMQKKANDMELFCIPCNFVCYRKSSYERHIITKRHIELSIDREKEKLDETNEKHICTGCGKEYKYINGLLKHKKGGRCVSLQKDKTSYKYICPCGKGYQARNSFWYHQKKCTKQPLQIDFEMNDNSSEVSEEPSFDSESESESDFEVEFEAEVDSETETEADNEDQNEMLIKENRVISKQDDVSKLTNSVEKLMHAVAETIAKQNETMIKLCEQNSELVKINSENTKTITNIGNVNNNNTQINVNVFLNDQCKDAVNLVDFVDSIKCQLTDLEHMGRNGYVEGISKVLIDNLSEMDVTKRPIHCTDSKRMSLYVKNNDEWHRDQTNNKEIKNAIRTVAAKNINTIPEYAAQHPEHNDDGHNRDLYLKIVTEAMRVSDEDHKLDEKIIRNVGKMCGLDRDTMQQIADSKDESK